MTRKAEKAERTKSGVDGTRPREVSKYQASPERQSWFARTYGSDLVIMPVAPRQRPSKITKKADEPDVLPTIKRDEEA